MIRERNSEKTVEAYSAHFTSRITIDRTLEYTKQQQNTNKEAPSLSSNERIHPQHMNSTVKYAICSNKKETPIQTVSFLLEGTIILGYG